MSKTIDEKIVEMRFDNKNFETNVKQTMSTLDRFKQKLNLTGASKGLENINTAANKVNMNGMAGAIENVRMKFSALEVMGVTALANITNSAINAGKRIVSALTIDPITTGFQEYETQINAIQTILANTQKEGTNVEIVNKALDELNEYADMTIYNFTEMTRNIGTFTAAGVKLDTSVKAIKGISNLAAVSGSSAQQASVAMYQLSQALASGTVKLMDWNSVVNAGMGGQVFQDALKETARVHGIAIDSIIKEQGSFRESLHTGWLTADILTETLEKFTLSTENMTEAEIKANRERLKSIGYTDQQIDEIFKLGNTATNAATKVKTFSQLWSTMKESAQSGWAQTWRIIVGDFEEAKELFTGISNFFIGDNGIITKMSNARNNLLQGALGKGFENLKKTLNTIVKPIKSVKENIDKVTNALDDLDKIVNRVILGEFGNGKKRFDALSEAGYNYYLVQNKVNEKLGDSFRYSEKLTGVQKELNKNQENSVDIQTNLGDSEEERLEQLSKMNDAELEALGLTKEQISALRELQKYVDMTGLSFKDFVENIDNLNGRWFLIKSFENIGKSLVSIFKSLGNAWQDVFPPMQSERLFELIAGFHKFSLVIKNSVENNADELTRTLRGLFSILGFITDIVGGGLKLAFNVIKTILITVGKVFGITGENILDVTAAIGDAIYNARQWIKENNLLTKTIEVIVPIIIDAVKALKNWIDNNEIIQNSIKKVTDTIKRFRDAYINWLEGLKESDNIPKYIIDGLVNGIKNGVTLVVDTMVLFGKTLIEAFKNILGIHSPSVVFFALGGFIVAGLLLGLQNGFGNVLESIKTFGINCIEAFKSIDFGKVLAAGIAVGLLIVVKNIVDAVKGVTKVVEMLLAPLEGLGNLLNGIGSYFTDLGKAKKMESYASVIKSVGVSILLLAGSLYIVSKIDPNRLWQSFGAISALMGIMIVFVGALALMSSKLGKISIFEKSSVPIVSIAITLILLATTLKQLASIESDRMKSAILGLAAVVIALGILIKVIGKSINPGMEKDIHKVGKMIRKIATSLLLLVLVVKLSSMLKPEEMKKGLAFITIFGLFIAGFIAISKIAGKSADKAGKMISKISVALLIMIGVVKLASMLDSDDISKGLAVITGIGLIFTALIAVSHLAGKNANKAGTMMLMMSTAMIIAIGVAKIAASMSDEEISKGLAVITGIGLIFTALVAVSSLAGENAIKAGTMLLLAAGAILILTGVLFLLSKMDLDAIYKSLGVIAILETLFAGLMFVSQFASDKSFKSLIVITVAITLLVAALIGLTFIDANKLKNSAVSISAIMVALSALIASSGKIGTIKDIGKIYLMLGVVAALGAIVALLSMINPQNAISSAIAVSTLLLAMSGALLILSHINLTVKDALTGILGLTAMAIPLLAFVGILALMSGIQNATTNALALVGLAGSMTLLLIALTLFGSIASASGIGIAGMIVGILGLTAMAIPLLAFVGILALMSGIQNAETNILLLTNMMSVLGNLLIQISLIAPLAILGVAAMSGLITLMGVVGLFAVAVGALLEKFPMLEEFMNRGIPILIQLASGIGQMVGAFVSGILVQVANGLPEIGTKLSEFMNNAKEFIDGAKNVDDSVVNGVKTLAGAVILLTAADLISGVASIIQFGSSFSTLGTELSKFILNATPFIMGSKMIDANSVNGVKTLAEAIMIITGAQLLEGVTRFFNFGESSITTFANQLPILGDGLNKFVTSIGDLSEQQVNTANNAANIIKTLANAAKEVPNSGGFLADLVGDNNLSTFALQFPYVGAGIAAFIKIMEDNAITSDSANTANTAANIIKTLASASKEIPNTGGFLGALVGNNDLSTFALQFPFVGVGIAGFIKAMQDGEITSDKANIANTAANIIKTLASVAKEIPNTGGFLGALVGDNDLSTFASQFPNVGKGIAGFVSEIGQFDQTKLDTVNTAIAAIYTINQLCQKDVDLGNIKTFGNNIKDFANRLKDFTNKINEIGSSEFQLAIEKVLLLFKISDALGQLNTDSLKTFGESLKNFAKDAVTNFVNELSGTDPKEKVSKGIKEMIETAITSADSKKDDIKNKFKEIAQSAIEGLQDNKIVSKAKTAGSDFVQGFANGIYGSSDLAFNAGYYIGSQALKAAKAAIDSNSPSKEAEYLGNDFDMGFVIGIKDLGNKVYKASYGVGENARSGLTKAISNVANIINTDIDTQPTIRPIMDLSNVESGVGYLSSMLSNGPSMGVTANLNAINSSMNAKVQNGVNSDVISAIDNLRKDLGNIGGNTYNVNGITYDDGSNITEAVKEIIRAAKIERRN